MKFLYKKQENLTTEITEITEIFKGFSPWTLCSLWLNLFRLVRVRVKVAVTLLPHSLVDPNLRVDRRDENMRQIRR